MRLLPILLLIVTACSSIDPVSTCTSEIASNEWTSVDQVQLQSDIQTIDEYLTANNITAIEHASGVRVVITHFGSGDKLPCTESIFTATYVGKLFGNNTVFDSSTTPRAYSLTQGFITGWKIGLLELRKGDKASIIIPSGLAYGDEDIYTGSDKHIPSNSILVFDVELIDWR